MTTRTIKIALALTLLGSAASAQGITTDPVTTSTTPFNAQNPIGDGVNVQQVQAQAVPVANASAGIGLAKLFDEADTNRDGVVTREEFLAKADRHFGMGDTNKDGKITRPEMEAQQASIMQQMQKNLFSNGNWQNKLNQFMGGASAPMQAAPTAPIVTRPSAPVAPSAPTTY